jgi:outer membrane biosynthesis protein TonB
MRLPPLISLSLLLFVTQKVSAQLAPADVFFNSGAQFYISNNIPAALERVESGLQLYPDDDKLKRLDELLKKQSQQQSQQNQQQQDKQQQDQKNQDQQNQSQQQQKDQQSQQHNSDDQKNQQQNHQPSQQKSPEQQKQEDQEKADQKKDQQQKQQDQKKSSPEKKDGGKPEDKNAPGQPVAPGQMTPEEAKRLLDAQKGDEQVLKLQPKDKPQDPSRPVKDW